MRPNTRRSRDGVAPRAPSPPPANTEAAFPSLPNVTRPSAHPGQTPWNPQVSVNLRPPQPHLHPPPASLPATGASNPSPLPPIHTPNSVAQPLPQNPQSPAPPPRVPSKVEEEVAALRTELQHLQLSQTTLQKENQELRVMVASLQNVEKELSGVKAMLVQILATINASPPRQMSVPPTEPAPMETNARTTQESAAPELAAPPQHHGPTLAPNRHTPQGGEGGQVNTAVSPLGPVTQALPCSPESLDSHQGREERPPQLPGLVL